MRVYIPDKRDKVISDALRELYLLGQSIDFQSGTPDSRIKMIGSIREKLLSLIQDPNFFE
jgi:hypothetical protein